METETEEVETKQARITAEVKAAIEALESSKGELVPADVVEAAADEASPLHPFFVWDDAEAAGKFRIEQARTLIRRIKFDVIVDEVTERVVQYVHQPESDDPMYQSLPRMRSSDRIEAVLNQELARVEGNLRRTTGIAQAKADDLPDGMVKALKALLAGVVKMRKTLESS